MEICTSPNSDVEITQSGPTLSHLGMLLYFCSSRGMVESHDLHQSSILKDVVDTVLKAMEILDNTIGSQHDVFYYSTIWKGAVL